MQISAIEQKNAAALNQLREERGKQLPSEVEVSKQRDVIRELEARRAKCGIFRGKERRAIQERLDKEYGWKTPWKKPYHLNRQLKQLASNHELIFSAEKYDEMDSALEKADLKEDFPSDLNRERICIFDSQNNQFMSVFYHLRNAFAHCRLNMVDSNGECVFIIEDVKANKNDNKVKVSARMILRKSTLLKWIDLIEHGERMEKSDEK